MDLTLLVTRSSECKQGGMSCILVKLPPENEADSTSLFDRIVSVSTNRSLYKENSSDIHAENFAIGEAAKAGRSTDQSMAYITMPPCSRCFAALLSAGIRRVVSRYHAKKLQDVADKNGIEMSQEQRSRIDNIVRLFNENHGIQQKRQKTQHQPKDE